MDMAGTSAIVEFKGPPLKPCFKTVTRETSSTFSSNIQFASDVTHSTHYSNKASVEEESTRAIAYTRPQLIKNLLVFGLGFSFVFSVFRALQSLQTSLYVQTQIGAISLTCVCGTAALTSLFGPAVVQLISANWTMIFTYVVFAIYFSTQFYPQLYSIVPSSVLLGLFLGPFYSAHSTYFMNLVTKYTHLCQDRRDRVLGRMTRLYHIMIHSSQIWGHVITAMVLTLTKDGYTSTYILPPDSDFDLYFEQSPLLLNLHKCDDCDSHHLGSATANDKWTNYVNEMTSEVTYYTSLSSDVSLLLISIYLGLVLLGIAVTTAFLDRIELTQPQYLETKRSWHIFKTTLLSFLDQKVLLILPLSFFIGLERGYIYADYTKSYVTCSLGLPFVSYTLLCLGVLQTLALFTLSHFVKHLQRLAVLGAGFTFHTGLLAVLWLWRPAADDSQVFYVISAGWGLCDAIWEHLSFTLLTTLYFDNFQGPFALYHGAQMAGMALAFGYHHYLCNSVKIALMAVCLPFSVFPFGFLEYKVQQYRRMRENLALI